ncbi:MAG: HD domain-containing protein [Bacilli bacterium]|nr:HD domain-containing protein [Bacilli bacterium]
MNFEMQDSNYAKIVENIMKNEEFNKLKLIEHHGISRFDHSVRVSYYSYKIAKMMHLDYEQTARGGLLHDFFLSHDNRSVKEKFVSTFIHPAKALETARKNFTLTRKEEDMIRSHMFPINISVPKYLESWIVSGVDKVVAVKEFSLKFRFKFRYAYNIVLLFIIGFIK